MAVKVVYSNSCIPEERVDLADGTYKWYLDSDSSKKMSGRCEPTVTMATTYYGTGILAASGTDYLESSDNTLGNATSVNFAHIKNTGENDLAVNIANRGTRILLGEDESLALQLNDSKVALTSTLGTNYEYFLGKDA